MRTDHDKRILGCRSEPTAFSIDHREIRVLGENPCTLKAGILDSKVREIIAAVRAGEHVTVELTAVTFRQKAGVPNRRGVRFADDSLEAIAASFVGMPVLLDHNSWEQSARIGTITSCEVDTHGGTGWSMLRMKLSIVKPDAVISVLDGTIDRFSIGWIPTGPILCTVHRTDKRSANRCSCWPLDKVEVDGKSQVVEFEFQAAEGIEVSAVNVPAVKGTKIEDIRSALALELGISLSEPTEGADMSMKSLAAILGLAALATPEDEGRAVGVVEGFRRGQLAAEQERDAARTELAAVKTELATARTVAAAAAESAMKTQLDALISAAYREGKLRWGRDEAGKATPSAKETRLRRIAKEDGLDALRAELLEMDAVVPIGQRVLTDEVPEPTKLTSIPIPREVLASTARQLGLKVEDLEAQYASEEG